MFPGKKTYALGSLAVIVAMAGYIEGAISLAECIQLAFTGAIAITLRAGVAKSQRK